MRSLLTAYSFGYPLASSEDPDKMSRIIRLFTICFAVASPFCFVQKNNIFLRFCLCIFESDTVKSDCPVQIFRFNTYCWLTLLVWRYFFKKKALKINSQLVTFRAFLSPELDLNSFSRKSAIKQFWPYFVYNKKSWYQYRELSFPVILYKKRFKSFKPWAAFPANISIFL